MTSARGKRLRQIPIVLSDAIDLEGDYDGFWVKLRRNLTLGMLEEIEAAKGSKDFTDLRQIIGDLVGDWNVADPREPEKELGRDADGMRQVPLDMLMQLTDKLVSLQQLPKGDAAPSTPTTPPSS